jgi:hypothetical protein
MPEIMPKVQSPSDYATATFYMEVNETIQVDQCILMTVISSGFEYSQKEFHSPWGFTLAGQSRQIIEIKNADTKSGNIKLQFDIPSGSNIDTTVKVRASELPSNILKVMPGHYVASSVKPEAGCIKPDGVCDFLTLTYKCFFQMTCPCQTFGDFSNSTTSAWLTVGDKQVRGLTTIALDEGEAHTFYGANDEYVAAHDANVTISRVLYFDSSSMSCVVNTKAWAKHGNGFVVGHVYNGQETKAASAKHKGTIKKLGNTGGKKEQLLTPKERVLTSAKAPPPRASAMSRD